MRPTLLVSLAAFLMVACGETPTDPQAEGVVPSLAHLDDAPCDVRNNNTIEKITDCVTLDAVRVHQAALQSIADANGGTRAAGTPGYDASADYVADLMAAAGYAVTRQPFDYVDYRVLGPSILEQTSPVAEVYDEDVDYTLMSFTAPGDVTATVTAVDLDLGLVLRSEEVRLPETAPPGPRLGWCYGAVLLRGEDRPWYAQSILTLLRTGLID